MNTAPDSAYEYQVGGSLPVYAPTYVRRQADEDLYKNLKKGEFCYVLNSRQMGKSSLRVQVMQQLQSEGVACAAIDITAIGTADITPEQWYAGMIDSLVGSLNLYTIFDLEIWWSDNSLLSPVQRLSKFIETVLIQDITERIVIFIDEIDSILSLQFNLDDFFAVIRECYNRRADKPAYNRLTFALIGVSTPSDLIQDKRRTPFNIGCAINLSGFQVQEAQPLARGLAAVGNPQVLMQTVLDWTGGQPFLTQKVCKLVLSAGAANIRIGEEVAWVERLVQERVIENWEAQDEPEHLKTIRDRILCSGDQRTGRLLGLCQQILQQGEIAADDSPEQTELRLTGLVVKRDSKLRIYNLIYAEVFNQEWCDKQLAKLRPYADTLDAWVNSDRQDESRLLRGQALQDAQEWSVGKSLSDLDYQFLAASQELDKRDVQKRLQAEERAKQVLERANRKANRRIRIGFVVLGVTLAGAVASGIFAQWSTQQANAAKEKQKNTEAQINKIIKEKDLASTGVEMAKAVLKKAKQETNKIRSENQHILKEVATAKADFKKAKQETNKTRLQNQQISAENQRISKQAENAEERRNAAEAKAKEAQKTFKQAQRDLQAVQLEQAGIKALQQFESGEGIEALLLAIDSGQKLQKLLKEGTLATYPNSVLVALQTILDNPKEQNRLSGHQRVVNTTSFSPNGQLIATAGADGIVKIWNQSGELQTQWQAHQGEIDVLQFAPDGQHLATTTKNNTVQLWNISGKQLAKWQVPQISSVSFSSVKNILATGGHDSKIRLWDWSGKQLAQLNGNQQAVYSVNFSPDGQHLVTTGEDKILLWDLSTQQSITLVEKSSGSAAFSPDGQRIAASDGDGVARIWNLSGKQLEEFDVGNGIWISSISFSPDGQRLMTAGGKSVQIWDLSKPQIRLFTKFNSIIGVKQARLSPDGKRILILSASDIARIWKPSERQKILLKSEWGIRDATFSPDGKRIATAGQDNTVRLWDYLSGKQLAVLNGHTWHVERVDFSPNGEYLASTSRDGTVRLWNLSSQQPIASLKGYQNGGGDVDFSPNGLLIATASQDGTRLWNLTGKELALLQGHIGGRVNRVRFSPNGEQLATAGADGTVRLWNIASRKQLVSLEGHHGDIFRVRFSPNGEQLATAGADGTVRLWNLSSKQHLVLKGHQGYVYSVNFSPDGKSIASAGEDSIVRVWNLFGQQLTQFYTHQYDIWSVKFTPDGQSLVTAGQDGTVRLWKLEGFNNLDKLLERSCQSLKDYLASNPKGQHPKCVSYIKPRL
ncbi:AAA-like domain-containing protein [Brasilonema sp. UFV-L1]|uniref:WD40 domain-containing protein n=1 Tax=Brasilonema sp. UFV-L1 TaxID=2234130 RepID=UPI00145EBD28|nr:AAA-like domain-containing protein [Brasilonema sp. UFV-L1]NMG07883.1 hypothetical protein [Brasilonema sp. UFV-L1]